MIPPTAGRDRADGLGWLGLGGVVLVLSLTMDRLASQDVPPYAAPGLLPGLLGIAILLFGGLLALRGRRDGGPAAAGYGDARRLAVVLVLCLVFGIGLVGHGLPFWVAAAIFASVTITVLQQSEQPVAARRLPRRIGVAALIGLGAGFGLTLVFQDLFLVRLP